ncbi:hypothetical protein C8R43DRAFT_1133457 [Mycena crocata]|nr:hypothetical protein C8R43DRAFT_1133457 [Mycena crocata]
MNAPPNEELLDQGFTLQQIEEERQLEEEDCRRSVRATLHQGEALLMTDLFFPSPPIQSGPIQPYNWDDNASDEGYDSDSDSDRVPGLLSQEDVDSRDEARRTYFPQPTLVSNRTQDAVTAEYKSPAFDAHPVLRFMREPPGTMGTHACKCYCVCSECRCQDVELIERRWAFGLPQPAHASSIMTRGGFRRPLQPCPDSSHPGYMPHGECIEYYPPPAAVSTKEMGVGKRQDEWDYFVDWNRTKMQGKLREIVDEAVKDAPREEIQISSLVMLGSSPSRGSWRDTDSTIIYDTPSKNLRNDRLILVSADGLRANSKAINVLYKKRRVEPEHLNDPFATWEPLPDRDTDNVPHADYEHGASGEGDTDADDPDAERIHDLTGVKRKRTIPTNLKWCPLAQMYLDELLRDEGLGDAMSDARCGSCLKNANRMFRCTDCGAYIQCETCVKHKHTLEPLHRLKVWNGHYWQVATFKSLKIEYQLGYGGMPCPAPDGSLRTVVVMHTNGLHTVEYRECGCDNRVNNLKQFLRNRWYPATTVDPATCATHAVLDLFRLLNVVGNMSVHNFVRTLECLTDATRVTRVPDRYKAFGHMWRQYTFVNRAKHAGRGQDPDGLESTENGQMAEECWACPHEDKNIPANWCDVAPEFKFLYMLIIAMDANFRLKNRFRENEISDPSFGSGWGYFVESRPYKEHLKNYVAEKDVSTCIAFAALMQKDTRMTTGLRTSGVGGVVCARHELVRQQGMGDLQKGERFANMDYIFWSSILGLTALEKMPDHLKKAPEQPTASEEPLTASVRLNIEYGLPVWHAAAHERGCQAQNSLTYVKGAARTDGEGIERTWSGLNPAAWSTKEMGEGARHDVLEDRIDHHNWEKNISQGNTLARRLVVAMEEADIQIAGFEEVDKTLADYLRASWQKMIDVWIKDRTKPNPYVLPDGGRSGPSEMQVCLELKRDELNETNEAREVRRRGATVFLVAGMQLEELQRQIKAELKGRTLLVADQDGRITDLRLSFDEKLKMFRTLQGRHMPGVISIMEDEEERRDLDLPPPRSEATKLWMPSELTMTARNRACTKGLGDREVKLRVAQCTNALDAIRSRLYTKRHLLLHNNGVGQRYATRANTLFAEVQERIEAIAEKYRRARQALLALKGLEYCATEFPELLPADLVLEEEHEKDAKARQKLAMIGLSKGRHRNAPTFSKKKSKTPRRMMSWIWTARGAPDEDDVGLHESVRVEWSKALARKCRWTEEVMLLREEMKRGKVAADIAAGVDAYAARQAAACHAIARRFKTGWEASKADAVATALADDAAFVDSMADFIAAPEVVRAPREEVRETAGEDEGKREGGED